MREVQNRIEAGDQFAAIVYNTMAYQITKFVGAMAAALEGKVDAIVLTGGMARSEKLAGILDEKLSWIAPTAVFPGEFEMEGLAGGITRVLNGEEDWHEYTGVDVWTGFDAD